MHARSKPCIRILGKLFIREVLSVLVVREVDEQEGELGNLKEFLLGHLAILVHRFADNREVDGGVG